MKEEALTGKARQASINRLRVRSLRDSKRSPDELSIIQLARELDVLVGKYPRFRGRLYKLQAYVRNQLQGPEKKAAAVISCLKNSGWPLLALDELVNDTNFDDESVRAALVSLIDGGKVEEVNRKGDKPHRTTDGRPTDDVFYRVTKRPAAGPSPATLQRR